MSLCLWNGYISSRAFVQPFSFMLFHVVPYSPSIRTLQKPHNDSWFIHISASRGIWSVFDRHPGIMPHRYASCVRVDEGRRMFDLAGQLGCELVKSACRQCCGFSSAYRCPLNIQTPEWRMNQRIFDFLFAPLSLDACHHSSPNDVPSSDLPYVTSSKGLRSRLVLHGEYT